MTLIQNNVLSSKASGRTGGHAAIHLGRLHEQSKQHAACQPLLREDQSEGRLPTMRRTVQTPKQFTENVKHKDEESVLSSHASAFSQLSICYFSSNPVYCHAAFSISQTPAKLIFLLPRRLIHCPKNAWQIPVLLLFP